VPSAQLAARAAAAAAAGRPYRDDLAARVFRARYASFDLRTVDGTHIVVPHGTPWFAGTSPGHDD
jgi:hypothetical protein